MGKNKGGNWYYEVWQTNKLIGFGAFKKYKKEQRVLSRKQLGR